MCVSEFSFNTTQSSHPICKYKMCYSLNEDSRAENTDQFLVNPNNEHTTPSFPLEKLLSHFWFKNTSVLNQHELGKRTFGNSSPNPTSSVTHPRK